MSGQVSIAAGTSAQRRGNARVQTVVGIVVIITAGLLIILSVRHRATFGDGSLIVSAAGVAIGVASAVFLDIAGRLSRHCRAVWIGAALALYSVTVVPFATVQTLSVRAGLTMPSPLVARWAVIGLLILAIRPPRVPGRRVSWAIAGSGLLIALIVDKMVRPVLETSYIGKFSVLSHVSLVATMWILTAVLVINSLLERNGLLRPVCLGLLAIAATQLYVTVAGVNGAQQNPFMLKCQMFGLVLVLVASMHLTQRALRELEAENDAQRATLNAQATRLQCIAHETAERHHELRNGLASFAQCHHLLGAPLDPDEAALLRQAAASELTRLEAMLEGSSLAMRRVDYHVAPILVDLVALQRSAGHDVDLEVDTQLKASGSPAVLAQVLTNLLANCKRHASGTPVRISVSKDQDRVLIEVADGGPGMAPRLRQVTTERGGRTAGSGLGLHICAKLLEAQSGRLEIVDPRPGAPGCTVLVELPSAPDCSPSA